MTIQATKTFNVLLRVMVKVNENEVFAFNLNSVHHMRRWILCGHLYTTDYKL